MKYIKMLGLLAVAAAALMAFVGSASATSLTSPSGTTYTGTIHATAGITTLHGVATITCEESTVHGHVKTHGSSVTTTGEITSLTFSKCGTNHVTVKKPGTLELHTDKATSDGNGTLTSTGAVIHIEVTSLGITCEYTTNETDVGTVTGSNTSHAVLDIDSVSIPRTGGSVFCGSSGEWTGTYTVLTPSTLYVH